MTEDFRCDICTAPMEETSKTIVKGFSGSTGSNINFRKRRFNCTICDYQTTIYAGGVKDLEGDAQKAIDEAEAKAKKEEKNRE